MTVLIRADSYDTIGLGHIKRCAGLAQALSGMDVPSIFISAAEDVAAEAILEPLGVPLVRVDAMVNTDGDLAVTLEMAKQYQAQTIVIDSYAVDEAYFKACRNAGLTVVYFEDYGRPDWPVDAVINGLIGAEDLGYHSPLQMTGADFMVLGPEYWSPKLGSFPDGGTLEIMITVGGIDHYDLTSRTLALLDTFEQDLKIHAVIGPYFENQANIDKAAQNCRHQVHLHGQPGSLAPIISRCQMAVSAGGMTLYELAAFGVPTIGIWLWENQHRNVERLGEAGVIQPLGYEEEPGFDEMLGQAIGGLLEDPNRRRELSRAGTGLIDGQGAHRVAAALAEMSAHLHQPMQKVT